MNRILDDEVINKFYLCMCLYIFIYFYGNVTCWILVCVHVGEPDADFRISEECDECRHNARK